MRKEYLIKEDGWNDEAFEDVKSVLDALQQVNYELTMCQRTCTPLQMQKQLVELAEQLKNEAEYL
jgi:hypothetical protein